MRISFTLAILAAGVYAIPLTPAADLSQPGAGALMQIDAHPLESVGAPVGNHAPDQSIMSQTEVEKKLKFDPENHQYDFYAAIYDLTYAYDPENKQNAETRANAVKAINETVARLKNARQHFFWDLFRTEKEKEYRKVKCTPGAFDKVDAIFLSEKTTPYQKLLTILEKLEKVENRLKNAYKNGLHFDKEDMNEFLCLFDHVFQKQKYIDVLEQGIAEYEKLGAVSVEDNTIDPATEKVGLTKEQAAKKPVSR